MSIPKDEIRSEMEQAWKTYLEALEKSLTKIAADITQTAEMADQCTSEWCAATQHYLDDIANALFSISEPRWSSPQVSQRIKDLKHRVHDLYADYRDELVLAVPKANGLRTIDVVMATHPTDRKYLSATETLDYELSGASHLKYSGDPKIGRSEVTGASSAVGQ